MSNVVQFPFANTVPQEDEEPTLDPLDIFRGIRRLFLLGIIGQPAYAIGCQAAYLLRQNQYVRKSFITMRWTEIRSRQVFLEGKLAVGPPRVEEDFVVEASLALYQLHEYAFLLNCLDKKFFNQNGNAREHFTIPHPLKGAYTFDEHTGIHFRLPKMTHDQYRDTTFDISYRLGIDATSSFNIEKIAK